MGLGCPATGSGRTATRGRAGSRQLRAGSGGRSGIARPRGEAEAGGPRRGEESALGCAHLAVPSLVVRKDCVGRLFRAQFPVHGPQGFLPPGAPVQLWSALTPAGFGGGASGTQCACARREAEARGGKRAPPGD